MVCALALFACAAAAVKHVHLVDRVGANLLFRGGSPEVDKIFSVEALRSALNASALAAGTSLPSDYELVVINLENLDTSLLTRPDDGDNVLTEYDFFRKNPSQGRFAFWKMTGEAAHAASKAFDGYRDYLAQTYPTWGQDKLVERIPQLREMLEAQLARPQVIYFHW